MQLTKREKVFIAIFVVVMFITVYYIYFYQPLIKDIQTMSSNVEEVGDLSVLTKSKHQQLVTLKQEYERLSKRVSETLESLMWPDDQPGLVVHLHDIFSSRSTREYIDFGDLEMQNDFCAMSVSVTFSASYSDFKDILVQLEQSPYKNHIQSLNVQATDGGRAVSVNMSLKFYFKPVPSEQGLEYPFVEDGVYGKDNPFLSPGQ
jgi:Tfp pilus assembly protein PilO